MITEVSGFIMTTGYSHALFLQTKYIREVILNLRSCRHIFGILFRLAAGALSVWMVSTIRILRTIRAPNTPRAQIMRFLEAAVWSSFRIGVVLQRAPRAAIRLLKAMQELVFVIGGAVIMGLVIALERCKAPFVVIVNWSVAIRTYDGADPHRADYLPLEDRWIGGCDYYPDDRYSDTHRTIQNWTRFCDAQA